MVKKYSIPLVIAILIAVISVTGILAFTGLFSTKVDLTVKEPLLVSSTTPGYDSGTGTWTLSVYPGEVNTLVLNILNSGTTDIPVTVSGTSTLPEVVLTGTGVFTAAKSTTTTVTVTLTVSSSLAPGTYTNVSTITVVR